ncbi:MAG: PKD domain-containing protein [Flavobacteriales bacterium]|nr:PKD domain-containing protein [Flavobacteriales bacterium]
MPKLRLYFILFISISACQVYSQSVAGGYYHTVFLCADSTVWSSGTNYSGELGIDTTALPEPAQIESLQNIVAVVAGGNHSLALDANGHVFAWGLNDQGQLGDSLVSYSIDPIELDIENIIKVAAGESHSFAIRNDGKVFAWGKNISGQLGLGHNLKVKTPTLVDAVSNVASIAAGQTHTIVVLTNGNVWAWGDNSQYQLGNGTTISSNNPILVPVVADAKEVAAGFYHSAIVKNDGSIWTWGYNAFGMLGNGTLLNSTTPTPVAGVNNAIEISAGQYHTIARTADGASISWGKNNYGQVGNGSTQDESVPYILASSGTAGIFSGIYHSGFYINSGQPFVWGLNSNYQVGIGSTSNQTAPTTSNLGCPITKMEPVCFTEANFYPSSSNICQGSEINFTNMSSNSFDFDWKINGITYSQDTNFSAVLSDTGNYEIMLIANPDGCPDTTTLTITVDEKPSATLYSQGLACDDIDSLALVAVGSSGTWQGTGVTGNSFNPSLVGVGNHQVVYSMTNGSCTNFDTLTISVGTTPTADFVFVETSDTISFNNLSINATNYEWYFGDGQTSSQESPTYVYTEEGTYYVLLLATNICGTETHQQTITISATGISTLNLQPSTFNIYPNPARNKVLIVQEEGSFSSYSIVNGLGQLILSGKIASDKTEIDLSTVATGSYVIQLQGKEIINQPLIISK